jgi:D-glycero-alpha-D-manno-heptose-7-phosphate kinase
LETIFFKSPTRVDLAGGTLDLWPLYNFVQDACTVNVAIDIWTTCEIKRNNNGTEIKIESLDLKKSWTFADWPQFANSEEKGLLFYKSLFRPFEFQLKNLKCGFQLTTSSQSPIGGGLGGSSSLVISTLKAIHVLLNLEIPEPLKLVHLAHNIEAEMLRTPTGTQDYFPAVGGGLNIIDFSARQMSLKVQSFEDTPLAEHFLLVYTGHSHQSGLNNFEVMKGAVSGNQKVLDALKQIKDIANEMKTCVQNSAWNKLPELFRREYEARIQLTPAFSSPEIEKLNRICLEAGASAVKICGAGGGGCVLVWVSPAHRQKVVEVCEAEKFTCLNAKPVNPIGL